MSAVIGVVHPGEMGVAVGACLRSVGHEVLWASHGRSAATRRRADEAGLVDVGSLDDLLARCAVVVSVCPPHAAHDQALAVAGYRGCYVDANAVSPETARAVGRLIVGGGGTFVDGGIVGPPPLRPGLARLYLSGREASEVAGLFAGSLLEAIVVDGRVGSASAVKMTYAAWSKGSLALVLASAAAARAEGVDEVLRAEWARSQPDVAARLAVAARSSATKGWRWVGEMHEIAATMAAAGLPPGFHEAAGQLFDTASQRTAGYTGDDVVDAVLRALAP